MEHPIKDMDLSLHELGLQDAATIEALRSFVSAAEELANAAQRFPPTL
ncbi:hypothetical protein ACLBYG_00510 [Methylobacterium sp. D53M]